MMTVVQTRPDRVGDRYSYTLTIRSNDGKTGAPLDGSIKEAFDIEILRVDPSGMRVRVVQTKSEAADVDADSPGVLRRKALTGVPVEFETEINGYPKRVTNGEAVKAQMAANFAKLSPKAAELAPNFQQWLANLPDDKFNMVLFEKLMAIGPMQPRGVLIMGHHDLPSEVHTDRGGEVDVKKTTDVSLAPGVACRVAIERSTWTERPGGVALVSSSLKTDAVVDETDGWVVSLVQVEKTDVPGNDYVRTLEMARVTSGSCRR